MSDKATSTEAVTNQNSILKDIINSSWNAIAIIDLKGNFRFLNKAFAPVLGYSINDLLKMNLGDVLLQDSKDPFYTLLNDNQSNPYINKLTIGCTRKDQQVVYLEIVINLMDSKKMFVVNAHDVTSDVNERHLIDQFIIQFQIDNKGRFLKGSDAFYRLSGYSYDKLIYNDYKSLFASKNDKNDVDSYFKAIEDGNHWSGNLIIQKSDQNLLYVDLASKPSKNKYGDIVGHSAVMIDITSEVNLQKHEEFLEEKLIDEEEKLSIMTETMRTVAHEWRQPLNIISLDAQALAFDLDFEETVDKENIKEKLNGIADSTQKLSKVIEGFQGVTELKGSKKKRNIKDIVLEALRIADLDEKPLLHEDHQDTKSFRTYPKELATAISAILINAKEFVQNTDTPIINIKTYEDNNNIVCEISNNGGNIPNDIIDKIFAPYFSTKTQKNGVGLGLYNTKMIVEMHLKGTIKVINMDDNFVVFKLTFPIGALE